MCSEWFIIEVLDIFKSDSLGSEAGLHTNIRGEADERSRLRAFGVDLRLARGVAVRRASEHIVDVRKGCSL